MNCYSEDHPDCRHLVKHSGYWRCKIHGDMIISSEVQGCHYHELPGEHSLRVALQKEFDAFDRKWEEFDAWRDRCIRGGIRASVIVLIAYALFVWWMLS